MKYLKYKNKYLNLKNGSIAKNQIGGATPLLNILKNINLFKDEEIAKYLNPFNGAVLYRTSFIKNYYLLHNDKYNKYIKQMFHIIPNSFELNPTKPIKDLELDLDKLHNYLIYIGMYIAYNYIVMSIQLKKPQTEDKLINSMIIELNKIISTHVQKMLNQRISQDIIDLIKIIDQDHYDLLYSHILLSLVWSIAKNKDGIAKYYTGVKDIFNKTSTILKNKRKITELIPILNSRDFEINSYNNDKFLKVFYSRDEIILNKDTSFEDAFFKLFDSFYLFQVGTVNLGSEYDSYSDCGETSLRNFINIICYDQINNKFDISNLIKLEAIESVIGYYKKYNTLTLQHNGRDEWARITVNIPNVKYNSSNNSEIADGLNSINEPNMLTVVKHLFRKVTNWSDFKKFAMKEGDSIETELDPKGFGKIIIKYNKNNYIWHFQNRHYQLSEKNEIQSDIHFKKIKDDYLKRFILKSHNIYNFFDYLLSKGKEEKRDVFTDYGFLYYNFISANIEALPVYVPGHGNTDNFKYPIIQFFNLFFKELFSLDNPKHKYIYNRLFSNIMNMHFDTRIMPEINSNPDLLEFELHGNINNLYINSDNDNPSFIKLFDGLVQNNNIKLTNVIININNLENLKQFNLNKFTITNLSLIHTEIKEGMNMDIKYSTHINDKKTEYVGDFPDIFKNNSSTQKLLLTTDYKIVSLPKNLKELCLYEYNHANLSDILDDNNLTKLILNKYNKTLSIPKKVEELYLYKFELSDTVILKVPTNSKITILSLPSSKITDIVMLFKNACKRENECFPNIKKLEISKDLKNTVINEDGSEYAIEVWIKTKTKKKNLEIVYI